MTAPGGEVCGKQGAVASLSSRRGRGQARPGRAWAFREEAEAVRLVHEMACPKPNVLYVAELLNWRVQKLLLEG
jgi:hypothetical protein